MLVQIAEDRVLVGALAPGDSLQGGDVVDVDSQTAADWIAKGWAVPAEAGDKEGN